MKKPKIRTCVVCKGEGRVPNPDATPTTDHAKQTLVCGYCKGEGTLSSRPAP